MEKLTCQGCGKPLTKLHGNRRYHDEKCKQMAYRARKGSSKQAPSSVVPLVVLAGVDTLYLNVYYADPETFSQVRKPLDDALQALFNAFQQCAKNTQQQVETPWMLANQPLYMLSHGSGKQWVWILRNDLINVQIGTGDYQGLIAHMRVSSEYLWSLNALHHTLGVLNGFANALFAHEMYLVPSAIDLCADVANWPMTSLDPLAFVARAKKIRPRYEDESLCVSGEEAWNGRKLATLYIGTRTSPVHGKLYNKLKEIKDGGNKKSWFLDLYERNGWDGEAPITRKEVSFKREALHDLDIETIHDLMHNLKGLWAYAVGSETVKPWVRYTVPIAGDNTQTRWPLHPTWTVIQHAFDSLSEEPASDLIRLKKQQVNKRAAVASLTGYLATWTVWDHADYERGVKYLNSASLGSILYSLQEEMENYLQDKGVDFQELLQAKLRRYYKREAETREVLMKRVQSYFDSAQEAI